MLATLIQRCDKNHLIFYSDNERETNIVEMFAENQEKNRVIISPNKIGISFGISIHFQCNYSFISL